MPLLLEMSNEEEAEEPKNDQPEIAGSDLMDSSSPTEEVCSMYMIVY